MKNKQNEVSQDGWKGEKNNTAQSQSAASSVLHVDAFLPSGDFAVDLGCRLSMAEQSGSGRLLFWSTLPWWPVPSCPL